MINSYLYFASSAHIAPTGWAAITISFTVEPHITRHCNIMRWCNMMKDLCGMVFQSGMSEASEAHFCMCVCVGPTFLTRWLKFHSSRTFYLKPKKQRLLRQIFRLLPVLFSIPPVSLLSLLSCCCVCLAAFSDCFPIQAACFLEARFSKVQCADENVLVKMRRGSLLSGMLPLPKTAYQLLWWKVMMIGFYCMCRIFEL